MCVDSGIDIVEENRSLEYTKTPPSTFETLLPKIKSSTVQQNEKIIHSDTSIVGATNIKQVRFFILKLIIIIY